MRNLVFVCMIAIMTTGFAQSDNAKTESKRAVATYTGSSTQGYYFTNDLDESSMLFNKIKPEVLKKYDLANESYIRETFRIYYTLEVVDGKTVLTINNMELLDYDKAEGDIEYR